MPEELLVIIDPQYDFINEAGGYAQRHKGINQIREARARINTLLNHWARKNAVIVYSNYKANQFADNLSLCLPGTTGHRIDLENTEGTDLVAKGAHSCFTSEAFRSYLRTREPGKLILCGFLAEYCVKQTALDGLNEGYHVAVLKDCIGTADDVQERKEQTLRELAAKGAEIRDSDFLTS